MTKYEVHHSGTRKEEQPIASRLLASKYPVVESLNRFVGISCFEKFKEFSDNAKVLLSQKVKKTVFN